jgi:osmotically-inducible protein OsmY
VRISRIRGDEGMTHEESILDAARRAVSSEPRVRPNSGSVHLTFANGELTMEGEVDHVAAKKLALEAAARVPGVDRIIDRLHVRPATPMGDGEICDKVCNALLEEIVLASCTIRAWKKGSWNRCANPPTRSVRSRSGPRMAS